MTILDIKRYGDEVLRKPCKDVNKFSVKIRKLVDDLLETMYAKDGVGLAAPQLGYSLNIFVIDVSTDPDPFNPMVFVNPKIVKKEGGIISHEGCLSFPELYVDVKRYERIIVKAKDLKGRPFSMDIDDGSLLCRAIQHENDHLNKILFIDHMLNRNDVETSLKEKQLPPIQEEYLLQEEDIEKCLLEKANAVDKESIPQERS